MLNRRSFIAAALAAPFVLSSPAALAASSSDKDPTEWIVGLMNQLLDDIRKDPALKKANPEKVRTFVTNRIMPEVDFARMTRTAVGPQWRQATADQRAALQEGFQGLLTRVYSGAFSSVQDYHAEAVPARRPADASATAIVRTKLVSKTAKPVPVDYRLANKGGAWKVIDVNVSGIWLVQNYHSQFGSILANGGIPALVKAMNDKNSALNKDAAKQSGAK
ncbi:MAG: ABC transporter substrate-binding protein [Sutterellaceae bacterium]|nr:ABC transporter substrate-binding protein [Sutterellaceae bacterium]MDD7442391.1 ABC transporter substrate-binding protein [Sutterellaceae bacterium]MDY2867160.1 ABC transporter substrate-binding protein [Mesosutterella sp.]